MTNTLIIAVTAAISLGLVSTSVWAGAKQRHRWEGVAIGFGAAIVGGALINHHAYGSHSGPPVVFSFKYRENHRQPSRHHGYWQPYRGGHDKKWRSHKHGHHYSGCRQHGNWHGQRHRKHWHSIDRRQHGDKRVQNHGYTKRRFLRH